VPDDDDDGGAEKLIVTVAVAAAAPWRMVPVGILIHDDGFRQQDCASAPQQNLISLLVLFQLSMHGMRVELFSSWRSDIRSAPVNPGCIRVVLLMISAGPM